MLRNEVLHMGVAERLQPRLTDGCLFKYLHVLYTAFFERHTNSLPFHGTIKDITVFRHSSAKTSPTALSRCPRLRRRSTLARLRRGRCLRLHREGSLDLDSATRHHLPSLLLHLKKPKTALNRGRPRDAPRRGLDAHDLVDGRGIVPPASYRLVFGIRSPVPPALGFVIGVNSADRHLHVVPRVLGVDSWRRLQGRRAQGRSAACLAAENGHSPGRSASPVPGCKGRSPSLPLVRSASAGGQRPEAGEPLAQEWPYHR